MTLNNVSSISGKKEDVEGGKKAIEGVSTATAALGLHQCDWPYLNTFLGVNRKAGLFIPLSLPQHPLPLPLVSTSSAVQPGSA